MKELRFAWEGSARRIAFAFDPTRQSSELAGGNKSSTTQRRFYKRLIAAADRRFDEHFAALEAAARNR